MSDKAIIVRGIGKAYRIGLKSRGETHIGPVSPEGSGKSPKIHSLARGNVFKGRSFDTFWALKDLNFEIAQGEAVGIIGRNGAGKSTLLKILSRITRPTTGSFSIDGRVSLLLKIGTVFNPLLKAFVYIYLSGNILGIKRQKLR